MPSHPFTILRCFFLISLATFTALSSIAADSVVVEVSAGQHHRQGTVVFFDLPASLAGHEVFALTRLDTERRIPVQLESGSQSRLVWLISDLKKGQKRRYRLTAKRGREEGASAVTVHDDGKHLLVNVGNRPVLQYNHALIQSPDPERPRYQRSGHIHPLFNPSGQMVTDDFNPDHMHQHGVMFAWINTMFEGRPVDFWRQTTGNVFHDRFTATGGGTVFGFFTAMLRHVELTAPGGPKTALNETWSVRVYNFENHFLFDLESTQVCATNSPLQIAETPYGALAIRGSRTWHGNDHGDFLTGEGKTREDGNHTRPRWVDIHGLADGKPTTGVTVMDHPQNFRFPQPIRLIREMPYFSFSPMVLGPFSIEPGKPYVSRYRFYIHDGSLDSSVAEALWQDFAEPPEVRVVGSP